MARKWSTSISQASVAFKLEAGTGSAFLTCKLPQARFGFPHNLFSWVVGRRHSFLFNRFNGFVPFAKSKPLKRLSYSAESAATQLKQGVNERPQ